MLKKIVSSILIIIILTMYIPIQQNSLAISENNEGIETASERSSIETIDLTGIVAGTDLIHTHIYQAKRDGTQHWDECWICHNKINIGSHNLVVSSQPTCNTYGRKSCTDPKCGYSELINPLGHIYESTWYSASSTRAMHGHRCTRCNQNYLLGNCVDYAGNTLGCITGLSGTCAVCGGIVDGSKHAIVFHDLECENCNTKLFDADFTTEVVGETSTRITARIKPLVSSMTLSSTCSMDANGTTNSIGASYSDITVSPMDSQGYYTVQGTITFDKTTATAGTALGRFIFHYISGISGFYPGVTVKKDNYAPVKSSIQCVRTVPDRNYDRKAGITATYTDNYTHSTNVVFMRLLDSDKKTPISNYVVATRNGDTYTHTFDLVAEIREPKNVYIQVSDSAGNETILEQGAISVQYIDALAPRLTGGQISSTEWSKNKQITYTTLDQGIGGVEFSFNNETSYKAGTKNGDNYTMAYNFVGDVYGSVQAALYIKDALGNNALKKITISNIDNTAPTITDVNKTLSENRKSETLTVTANDINTTLNKSGSGIIGYAMSKSNSTPSEFQESNSFNVTENGTYYIWTKDRVGNISTPRTVVVDELEINILGRIIWDDSENTYNSRQASVINLYRKVGANGAEELATSVPITEGQTSYNFRVARTDNAGNTYIYRLQQQTVTGYETSYSSNNVNSDQSNDITINITNTLILPTYTSNITYTPINSFQNTFLKNGKVKIVGQVSANTNNRELAGVNNGIVTFSIDEGIEIDESKTVVKYYEQSTNTTHNITNYTISGNVITAKFGKDSNGISHKGDNIIIELQGKLNKIGEYSSNIIAVGNLIEYKGTNTSINLGQVTTATENIQVNYQLPKANIEIEKRDSITENKLTDVTFKLYEWNGNEYIEKETITDENEDGIYTSSLYEWNEITQGKYKIEETEVSPNHTDLEFNMEFNLNQLKTTDYTIKPDYTNDEYTINYEVRNPDDFNSIDGVVENEPWKVKASISKIDSETKNVIQEETEFTIYEWNSETLEYEEYISYIYGEKVNMIRQENKTYITGEWLYYTPKNEGKYRIIETKSPNGYYANYQESGEKEVYDINVVDVVTSGRYKEQVVGNESTLKIGNDEQNNLTNERIDGTLNVTVIDKETKGKAQADATISGAKYGLYALEQINHLDGITTRYEGEAGVLYKKDELIETQTTDDLGKMVFNNLECGKYYVKMIEAPVGYLYDETKYDIDFAYEGETQKHLDKSLQIEITVKKQAFELYKVKESEEVLQNAGFSIYLITDLSIVKEGKITRATKDTYYLNDEEAQSSDQLNGKQNTDGTYYLSDLIDYYWKINYTEENMDILPGDELVYHPYSLSNEIYVKDYSSAVEGTDIEEIRTDENGHMKSPELAYGEYIIIETSVPREQKVVKSFIIKVDEDNREPKALGFVTDKDFKTRIKIYVKDANTKNNILNKPGYYVIKNEETQEYMKNIQVNGEESIEQGTLEKPFVLGDEGYFITPMELPIGKYILEEVTAPEGYVLVGKEGYAQNKELINSPKEKVRFEVTSNTAYYMDHYLDTYVIVVEKEKEEVLGNITIKAEGEYLVNAEEVDENYKFTYETRIIPNVEYDIYAKEDIYSQDNHNILRYKKDEKVDRIVTNENGEITVENVPQGKYYVKETVAGNGFYLKPELQEIEINYQGQEVPVVFKELISKEKRQTVDITITNIDVETKEKIPGGKYNLYNKEEITYIAEDGTNKTIPDNTLLYTIEGDENGEIKFSKEINIDLPLGKYGIKEITAPKGYIKIEDEVLANAIGEEEKIKISVTQEREKTKISIENIGEDEEKITDAKITIEDKDGNVITQIDSLEEINTIEGLESEKEYIIKVDKPADGYVTNEDITFKINEDGSLNIDEKYLDKEKENTIKITSQKTKLNVIFKYKEELVNDIKFSIIKDKKIIASTENKEDALKIEENENGYYIEGIPINNYELIEDNIPYGLGFVEKQEVSFKIKDTTELQVIEVQQDISKLFIGIEDEETKEKISNVLIEIQDIEGKIVASTNEKQDILKIEETEEGYYLERLPVGEYKTLKISPDGYKTIENQVIKIEDSAKEQKLLLKTRKLIFDVGIEKNLTNIIVNGEIKVINDNEDIANLEIPENEISSTDVKLQYIIKVSNLGEIEARVEKILDEIPTGLTYCEEGSVNWKVNAGKATYEDIINLQIGESKEIPITLKWMNGEGNFGEKENTASLLEVSNKYGYKNSNKDNGTDSVKVSISKGKSTEVPKAPTNYSPKTEDRKPIFAVILIGIVIIINLAFITFRKFKN